MKDLDLIKQLLALLNETNAGAIEVRKNLWSTTIRVSRDPTLGNSGPVTYHVAANPGGVPAGAVHAPTAPAAPEVREGGGGTEAAAEAVQLLDVKSPMVGTFYAQPEPGAEPYVKVGSRIAPGQTLCIIEAMKIMNPIDAEVSGVVKEVAVQDSQAVEFGQVLFRVDPNG
ncbi:MAG: acetyl-CoA carboxylase biotin carboxyl carrier protein [Gemmatimonadota bacterium]|nr:MAG: acetyl-CoA carboxylase biotin carboxyl carrier protein [Gemmatimonadota bacterium]